MMLRSLFLCAMLCLPCSAQDAAKPAASEEKTERPLQFKLSGEGWEASLDCTAAPDLAPWMQDTLSPVIKDWYPKIIKLLPSQDYKAPTAFRIYFDKDYKGVAATMGTNVVCNPEWYRKELKREAVGSIVHELVHVVQQYKHRVPSWVTEGIADYIRWFLYEPESKGALLRPNQAAQAKHNASYRVSANFFNFLIEKKNKDLLQDLNATLREGKFNASFWQEKLGADVDALATQWKEHLTKPAEEKQP